MTSSEAGQAMSAKETARIEAFSDGVFAIAITLLILEIKVPHHSEAGAGLGARLLQQWPSYVAFLTSFATIGIMWINHHRLFTHIERSNHALLILNGLLLLGVTVVPFPTAVLAEYIGHEGKQVAAMVYTGTFLIIAIFFNLLWRYASKHLLGQNANLRAVQEISKQYMFGPLFYLVCFALAPLSVAASLGMSLALALFFALPRTPRAAARKSV